MAFSGSKGEVGDLSGSLATVYHQVCRDTSRYLDQDLGLFTSVTPKSPGTRTRSDRKAVFPCIFVPCVSPMSWYVMVMVRSSRRKADMISEYSCPARPMATTHVRRFVETLNTILHSTKMKCQAQLPVWDRVNLLFGAVHPPKYTLHSLLKSKDLPSTMSGMIIQGVPKSKPSHQNWLRLPKGVWLRLP